MAVFAGNGSNGSPSFTFSSSPTTGIYRPAADAITLVTGGSNRFTINGTNTIVSSTTTPRTNVRGLFGAVTPNLNVEQAIGYISVVSNFDNTTVGAPGELQLCRSGATAVLSNTAVANGNWLGMISFQGADGSDMEYAARIRAIADGTVAANQMPGTLIFETTPTGSATPAEVVRMTTDKYLRMASGTGGIQFNGNTDAANALDDYEEGTFTLTFGSAGDSSGASIGISAIGSTNSCKYTKIGNKVTITGAVNFTGGDGASWALEDFVYLTGIPFTWATDGNAGGSGWMTSSPSTGNMGTFLISTPLTGGLFIECVTGHNFHNTVNSIQFSITGLV